MGFMGPPLHPVQTTQDYNEKGIGDAQEPGDADTSAYNEDL